MLLFKAVNAYCHLEGLAVGPPLYKISQDMLDFTGHENDCEIFKGHENDCEMCM